MTQLVVKGNRILAYGEDRFICVNGNVICTNSNEIYEGATIAKCDYLPADIDVVDYEYNCGEFVPSNNVKWKTISSVACVFKLSTNEIVQNLEFEKTFTFPIEPKILTEFSMLRYKIKADSYFRGTFYIVYSIENSTGNTYDTNIIKLSNGNSIFALLSNLRNAWNQYTTGTRKIIFKKDIVLPCVLTNKGLLRIPIVNTQPTIDVSDNINMVCKFTEQDGSIVENPHILKIGWTVGGYDVLPEANIIIELEGIK